VKITVNKGKVLYVRWINLQWWIFKNYI
jgi:hypothetical protein